MNDAFDFSNHNVDWRFPSEEPFDEGLSDSEIPIESKEFPSATESSSSDEEEKQPAKKQGKFALQAKTVFLTYPQSGCLRAQQVIEHVSALETSKVLTREGLVYAQEEHKDGTPHFHFLFKWSTEFRSRDCAQLFDVKDDRGKVHHPNIQSARAPRRVQRYIEKVCDAFCDLYD